MIAFLGWGSLIWDPRDLPIIPPWHPDGPPVRVEFLRQSMDGRLTLVLADDAAPVRALWVRAKATTLEQAKHDLRVREKIPQKHLEHWIGSWSRGCANPSLILDLDAWADEHGVEHVVWTALPSKFNDENGTSPSIDQAVQYLSGLQGTERALAEEYVRRAPPQVATAYRQRFEVELGWSSQPA
ncbi:hypothetical protein AB6N01_16190 [Alcaligenes nematophilus]|uniref:hypothetical protein n=1 Tax=Alcaligenes nematophilus TaxID=2994643 RepID=UPI0034E06552